MPFFQQASTAAAKVDGVFFFIFALSAAFLIFITTLMLYFVFRYGRKRNPRGKDIADNLRLEIVWTTVPTVLFLAMFYFGWTNYNYMRNVPRDAMVITTTARQWAWSFSYPNGKKTRELYLALDKPVRLNLQSLDVIHGFFVPAFRIKEDVVPGKQNYTWFTPNRLGSYDIECTVICGLNHANMLSKAVVVSAPEFEAWYFGDEEAPLPGQPKVSTGSASTTKDPVQTLLDENTCLTCHSLDGEVILGPSFKGIYGQKVRVVGKNGKEREVTIDDAYLTRSIADPEVELVKGFPPVMPTVPLKPEDVQKIIAFIKTLK